MSKPFTAYKFSVKNMAGYTICNCKTQGVATMIADALNELHTQQIVKKSMDKVRRLASVADGPDEDDNAESTGG